MFTLSKLDDGLRQNSAIKLENDEKKARKPYKFLQTLKSCFGYGSIEVDVPSRNEYQRTRDPATGFEGEQVYGIQAEYLDEEDMAWGKPNKSKRQARRNFGSQPEDAR